VHIAPRPVPLGSEAAEKGTDLISVPLTLKHSRAERAFVTSARRLGSPADRVVLVRFLLTPEAQLAGEDLQDDGRFAADHASPVSIPTGS
jgi:hypothetical protein